jgi:hypothetical protein
MSEDTGTELVALQPINAVTVFGTEGGSDSVLDAIRKQVEGLVLDISTEKGRKEIASVAYKIARTKTALDDQGKTLKAEMQKTVDLVDGERKKIRDGLDALKEEVRKPLTDWENAEKLRVEGREARILAMKVLTDLPFNEELTVEMIDERLKDLSDLEKFEWQEFIMRAEATAKETREKLEAMKAKRIKDDADKAELERLRKEQEERERKEREDRIAAEAAEKAKREAEEKAAAEAKAAQEKADREKREADERAENERKAKEKAEQDAKDAQARADKAEADRKAAEEKAEADRIAAKKKADEDAKAAADKAAQEERDRQAAEQKRIADEEAKRQADKEHRGKVNREVLEALVKKGITEDHAKTIITAIVKGEIPHTKINY